MRKSYAAKQRRNDMTNPKATHLGDGAYASVDAYGNLVLTANHHDPDKATDVVVVEPQAVIKLAAFIKEHYQEE
jgi:hypothetical protein